MSLRCDEFVATKPSASASNLSAFCSVAAARFAIDLDVDGNYRFHCAQIDRNVDLCDLPDLYAAQIDNGSQGQALNISLEVSNGSSMASKKLSAAERDAPATRNATAPRVNAPIIVGLAFELKARSVVKGFRACFRRTEARLGDPNDSLWHSSEVARLMCRVGECS